MDLSKLTFTEQGLYRAGVAAGRASISVMLTVTDDKGTHRLLNTTLAFLAKFGKLHEAGPFTLLVRDEMPDFEDFPDQEPEQAPDSRLPIITRSHAWHLAYKDKPDLYPGDPDPSPHAQGRAVDILGPGGSIIHLTSTKQ